MGTGANEEDNGGREEQNKPDSDKTEEGCGRLLKADANYIYNFLLFFSASH